MRPHQPDLKIVPPNPTPEKRGTGKTIAIAVGIASVGAVALVLGTQAFWRSFTRGLVKKQQIKEESSNPQPPAPQQPTVVYAMPHSWHPASQPSEPAGYPMPQALQFVPHLQTRDPNAAAHAEKAAPKSEQAPSWFRSFEKRHDQRLSNIEQRLEGSELEDEEDEEEEEDEDEEESD